MKGLLAALWAEGLKIRRSRMLWIMAAGFSIAPVVMGFLMFVLKNPEFARNSGLIGAKAALAGTPDWPSYLGLLGQAVSVGGIIGFGFITSWVFGREYSDRTAKDLLALPIPRSTVVSAKFAAVLTWSVALSLLVFVLGLLMGRVVGLSGWSQETVASGFARFFTAALLTMLLSTPVAFAASSGRGYLPPLGFVVLALIAANIVAALGHGAYFPWSVPSLFSGAAGPDDMALGPASYIILALTSLAGLAATYAWWRHADQV